MSAADLPDPLALSRRVLDGGELTREEARALFALEGEAVYDLFYAAHKVRRHFHGNRVTFCSILPTKFGNCSEDCKFCAQSGHFETGITPHTMMDGAEVGPDALIERSVIGAGARAGEGAVLHDAVIGDHAVVGARCELREGLRVWPGVVLPDGAVRFSADV